MMATTADISPTPDALHEPFRHMQARLIALLLRHDADRFRRELTTYPDYAADADAVRRLRRQGYAVDVVTATEDWGIRHVIGGIAPRLERTAQGRSIRVQVTRNALSWCWIRPAGIPVPASRCQRGSSGSMCRPIRRNCSLPNGSGA
jgi:hypothetical protein